MGWMVVAPLILAHGWVARHALWFLPGLAMGFGVIVVSTVQAMVELHGKSGRFHLRALAASGPAADRLLAAASETGARLAVPEVRALFADVSRELYRLARRAEELASRNPNSSEAQLARRLLASAPVLGAELATLAERLETLDAALDGNSEGDAARALAALARREAAADGDAPATLAEARRELEAALDRRVTAEAERERLAAALCRLLATVRDVYGRAVAVTGVAEREAAALEAALRELEAT